MTQKEKLLAAARGERLRKLPFGARIDLWYNYNSGHKSLPEKYNGWDQTAIIRDQGAAAQQRYLSVVKEQYNDMEVIEKEEPPYIKTEFRTPIGSVYKTMLYTTLEGPWIGYEVEKLFKSEKDYTVIEYMLQHTTSVLDPGFNDVQKKVGDDGIVVSGVCFWSPTQRIMREIMGFETFFYELADNPKKVESLIKNMESLTRKEYDIGIKADLEIFNIGSNWSDDVHTPVFEKYFIPWFQEITGFLHSHGKLAMAHVDGENKRLLKFFNETGIDVWEAWTPSPMTSISTAELRKALGNKGVIWGGVPSTLFEPTYSDKEFDQYVINLINETAPGYNFIVGMGDNLPFDGIIERVGRIVELIDKYGSLPISS